MQRIRAIQFGIPLFVRVVCLYGVPLLFILPNALARIPAHEAVAISQPAIEEQKLPTKKLISGHPERMEVKRLGITLPIVDGTYNPTTTDWTLSDSEAQFARDTIRPNDSHGITFLYGHNTMAVFKPLRDLRNGDQLVIHTSNKHVFVYSYIRDKLVTPEDTSVLYEQSSEPRIALITCDGLWSEKRRIMYFNLREVT